MDSLIFELQIIFYFQLFLSANVRHSQYDLTLVLEVFLEIFLGERESEPRGEREKPLVTLASNLALEKPLEPG